MKNMILLIIYLIGVFINCYFVINDLICKYNTDKIITVGEFTESILKCLTSWLSILLMLIAFLCMHIYILFNKPLFKKK